MKNSKLLRVLGTCSKTELGEIQQFLATPLFNTRKDVQQLFDYLQSFLLKKKNTLDKKEVYQTLFPKKKFTISKVDLLMSYLFRLVQHYLTWKTFAADEHTQKRFAIKAFQERGLTQDFQQQIEKFEQQLAQQPIRDVTHYQLLYQLQWEEFQAKDRGKPEKDQATKWQMMETLDVAYIANKLRHACLLKAHQLVYPLAVEPNFLSEILAQIEQGKYLTYPAIHLYYHCYLMLTAPETVQNFRNFKDLLFHYDAQFSDDEKRNLLLMGINYCVRQINEGQSTFLSDLLTLYEGGLANNFLLENNLLSRFTFHNIVGTGLATNKIDWVESFIANYKNNLPRKDRESTYSFSMARLAYHRKDYAAVLELLQKSNYRDLLLNLAAKTLLLKVYVETDEDLSLHAHLSAMEQYIRRKRVIGYHKKNYLNIIKYTKKMRSLNFFDKAEIEEFKTEIQREDVLTEKTWFLEQSQNF